MLAFRLAHFNNFWLGRPDAMRASVERVKPAWNAELPAYGTILSCHCFALEECGDYAEAEASGRAAIEIDPGDVWGTHGVAHVMEMQGRHDDGIAWLDELERNWDGAANLVHHLWWHRALFHLERREFEAVLDLYDRRFRNLSAPLTQAQPDLYIDVQNAASMLMRLELLGLDVGDRWSEIADKAQARVGDCLSAFTQPHWMMALAAAGRDDAAQRMLDALRATQAGQGTVARIVAEVGVAGERSRADASQGRVRARARSDAPGARRRAPAWRQPRAAGRFAAAISRLRLESRLRRRRAPHT